MNSTVPVTSSPTTPAPATHDPYPYEYAELVADYLKYLTTLSTGSVALQIAFLEKIFPHPKWKAFIVISLLSFTVSIISSALSYTALVGLSSRGGRGGRLSAEKASKAKGAGCYTLGMTLTGFVIGVMAIIIFVLKNLFAAH